MSSMPGGLLAETRATGKRSKSPLSTAPGKRQQGPGSEHRRSISEEKQRNTHDPGMSTPLAFQHRSPRGRSADFFRCHNSGYEVLIRVQTEQFVSETLLRLTMCESLEKLVRSTVLSPLGAA